MYNLLNVIARPRRRPNIDRRVRMRPRGDGLAPLRRGRGLVEAGAEVHADGPRRSFKRPDAGVLVGSHHPDGRREIMFHRVSETT